VCLIIDANVAPKFLVQPSAILDWLLGKRGAPRLVAAGKLLRELAANDKVRKKLAELDRAGRLRRPDTEGLRTVEQHLQTTAPGNVRKSVESRDSHLTYSTMLFSA
jgi:hypothetical protein